MLDFSEALDPASAVNLANYRLVTAGRDKKFGTKDDKVVALRSATYNPTSREGPRSCPARSSPLPSSTASPSTARPPLESKTSPATCSTAIATAASRETSSESSSSFAPKRASVSLERSGRKDKKRG